MILSAVVAISRNGVIGHENSLPWHLPDDLRNFRRITLDKPVIMGRMTWESLPKGLPRRRCIVISGRPVEGKCEWAKSPDEALELCAGNPEVMIIGGVKVYHHFLPLCDRLYLTAVDADIEGDARLPELNLSEFTLQQEQHHPADDRHAYSFCHQEFFRIKARC